MAYVRNHLQKDGRKKRLLSILDLAGLPQATVTRMPRLESWEITEK